ncbi:hypothetical protein [Phytohabitans houttuyneae]|uniref:Uncharacterized protein n=1 Tax=Phytohabitans houttuyneae TaxID=1076126 RepID=A0A6V8JXI2_9ACTN|nr:hypothetical protein [Phytohabitans houttuyneae]GFJ77432.1 hypothetical protein Phou_016120 [Phytohabitans houttuyneae]
MTETPNKAIGPEPTSHVTTTGWPLDGPLTVNKDNVGRWPAANRRFALAGRGGINPPAGHWPSTHANRGADIADRGEQREPCTATRALGLRRCATRGLPTCVPAPQAARNADALLPRPAGRQWRSRQSDGVRVPIQQLAGARSAALRPRARRRPSVNSANGLGGVCRGAGRSTAVEAPRLPRPTGEHVATGPAAATGTGSRSDRRAHHRRAIHTGGAQANNPTTAQRRALGDRR